MSENFKNNQSKSFKGISSWIGIFILGLFTVILTARCGNPEAKESSETALDEKADQELLDKANVFFASISSLPKEAISEKEIALGKKLYYDKSLSKDGTISCNSCHNLKTYGVDNLSFSPGDTKELGGRNSPTSVYAYLHTMQFWDARAKDVEEQAGGPILNPVEHNIPSEEFLEKRLRSNPEYQKTFKEVYPDLAQPITFQTITKAIGAFERQLAPESRFDKWLDGDQNALTAEEKVGLTAFIDNACITCHMGPALGGTMLQKFGLFGNYWDYTKSKKIDDGLFDITQKETDRHYFKVPGLRNIEKTYPYFHDGSVEKLEDAVRIMGSIQLANKISEEDVQSITTFLKSLTADVDDKYKE